MGNYVPEIGQAVFGCNWGVYDTPLFVDALLEHILGEIDRVYWNVHQRKWDEDEDPAIPGIEYHYYYWDECLCMFDEEDGEWQESWEQEHQHSETCFSVRYRKEAACFPDERMVDWDMKDKHMIEWAKANGLPSAPRGMAVYCDCGYDKLLNEEYAKFRETHNHTSDCPIVVPNLKFGEVEIRWYKNPGRGQSCNVDWDERAWRQWFDRCIKTIQAADIDIMEEKYER